MSAQKLDAGKAPMWRGLVAYFPNALSAVAQVSQMGKDKYGEWGGWRYVEGAEGRYTDALMRHMSAVARGELFDPESGLPHKAHAAWNALAILEMQLGSVAMPSGPQVEPASPSPTLPNPTSNGVRYHDPSIPPWGALVG